MSIPSSTFLRADYQACKELQSNSVNMDTEGAIESVRIKLVEFRENAVGAFFPQGQGKLAVIMSLYMANLER